MLRTIDRPTSATWRSHATAASRTCWTRCTCEAKQATMTRPLRLRDDVGDHLPTSISDGMNPGHLGVGRVGQQQVDAAVTEAREAGQVGEPAVERGLVHLEVAGVQHRVVADLDRDGERVRDRVVHREVLQLPRPELGGLALAHPAQVGLDLVLLELRRDQGEGQPRAVDRDVGHARAAGTAARRCGPRGRG